MTGHPELRMTCTRCDAVSGEGSRFCGDCGAPLHAACPRCGVEVAAGARFCRHCGRSLGPQRGLDGPADYTPAHLVSTILGAAGAREGERKQVTVLFCRLAGAAGLAGSLGPEGMHAFLERFFALGLREIQRYEGTINQYLEDGFMALFGAPVAREDHARRAVLAALGLQRAARDLGHGDAGGESMAARIGINTGTVVVGAIGDEPRMDYTAVGDTTNVAWRLAQEADAGDILIGESTALLAQGYVRMETLPTLALKGKAVPVAVRRVLGPGPRRSRLDATAGRALTEFTGREDELAHLETMLARAASGRGQVLGMVGEPGVGKSRLLAEFRRRLLGRPVAWLEGHCVPYGHGMPYLPVLEMLRQICGLSEDDRPEIVAVKLRACLREAGLDPDEDAPPLLNALKLADGGASDRTDAPEAAKARTFELLRRLMLAETRRRPLILVVEDLHWVDAITEEYAASLVERAAALPILIVFSYRPGYRPRWIDRSSGTQLALAPLGPAESRDILRAFTLSAETTERILDRAEGNPLFLEELARGSMGAGGRGPDVTVPDTVHDVLSARVDHLPETARRVLQYAAVLGRQFSARLLRAVWDGSEGHLEADLQELGRQEFLEERAGAGEPTFVFKQALVRDVIYGSLLERQRRAVHERAAVCARLITKGPAFMLTSR